MNKTMQDFILPTAVLTIICFVVSAALSYTYGITAPVIEENNRRAANAAMIEVLPAATDFHEMTDTLPSGVDAIYISENDAGVVVKISPSGYDGPITMMVGIDNNGIIAGVTVLENSETQGLGSKAMDPAYTSQFAGKSSPEEVESIAGATISSTALKKGIQTALDVAAQIGGIA